MRRCLPGVENPEGIEPRDISGWVLLVPVEVSGWAASAADISAQLKRLSGPAKGSTGRWQRVCLWVLVDAIAVNHHVTKLCKSLISASQSASVHQVYVYSYITSASLARTVPFPVLHKVL